MLIEVPLSCYDESCKHWPTFNSAPNERLAENYKTATAFCFYVLVIIGAQVLQRVLKLMCIKQLKKIVPLSGKYSC